MGVEIKYRAVGISLLENWPQASVKLEGMSATCIHSGLKDRPFLLADNFFVSFSLRDLINGETVINDVSLKNGRISLEIDSLGRRNFDFRKRSATSNGKSLDL